MAFTLENAADLWNRIQGDESSKTPLSVIKGRAAMDLEAYQSNADLEEKLRAIFRQAKVEYPESSHALHLKTTLLTALSRLDDEK